jgi:hypothetical protein
MFMPLAKARGLVKEFCQKVVWPNYPGGIRDAIQDMMKKALQEQK